MAARPIPPFRARGIASISSCSSWYGSRAELLALTSGTVRRMPFRSCVRSSASKSSAAWPALARGGPCRGDVEAGANRGWAQRDSRARIVRARFLIDEDSDEVSRPAGASIRDEAARADAPQRLRVRRAGGDDEERGED